MESRLEYEAQYDRRARRAYARQLKRCGDIRGRLLELSMQPGRYAWLNIHDTLHNNPERKRLHAWLKPYISDWCKLILNHTHTHDLRPLAHSRALQHLNLNHTRVDDLTPLKHLTRLKRLFASHSPIHDLTPLACLTQLERLDVSHTQVDELNPLATLTALQRLYLSNIRTSDFRPLKHLVELEELDLDNTRISNLTPLKQLTQLRRLYLGHTHVDDLAPLEHLTELEELDLSHTGVMDLSVLKNMRRLRYLDLSDTPVNDLRPLAHLPELRELNLCGDRSITSLRPLEGLKYLKIITVSNRFWYAAINPRSSIETSPTLRRQLVLPPPPEPVDVLELRGHQDPFDSPWYEAMIEHCDM